MGLIANLKAPNNGRKYGNEVALYLGIDCGIFHMSMENGSDWGGLNNHMLILDSLSVMHAPVDESSVMCLKIVATGLEVLEPKLKGNSKYTHACNVIWPMFDAYDEQQKIEQDKQTTIQSWHYCEQTKTVQAQAFNTSDTGDLTVGMSYWRNPNEANIYEEWHQALKDNKTNHKIVRAITVRFVVTFSPALLLSDEPCELHFQYHDSIYTYRCDGHKQLANGNTRIVMTNHFNVTDIRQHFVSEQRFGLIVTQGDQRRRAILIPKMPGFQESFEQMADLGKEPPAQAA